MNCLNRVRLVQLEPNADGSLPAGAHVDRATSVTTGERLSAVQDGVSDLLLNDGAELWTGSFDDCREGRIATGVGQTMVLRVLTHELGLVLGLEHGEVKSVMYPVSGECWDLCLVISLVALADLTDLYDL